MWYARNTILASLASFTDRVSSLVVMVLVAVVCQTTNEAAKG